MPYNRFMQYIIMLIYMVSFVSEKSLHMEMLLTEMSDRIADAWNTVADGDAEAAIDFIADADALFAQACADMVDMRQCIGDAVLLFISKGDSMDDKGARAKALLNAISVCFEQSVQRVSSAEGLIAAARDLVRPVMGIGTN